jgi:hypothetical protein
MGFLWCLEEQVGPAIDEEVLPDRFPGGRDPLRLNRDRVEPFAANHLILEVATDRAGLRQSGDVARSLGWIVGIGAFEIDGDRQIDRSDNPPGIGQHEVHRHPLAVAESIGHSHRSAAGGDGLGAGLGDSLRAAHVPDVEQDEGGARHVQRGKALKQIVAHDFLLGPTACGIGPARASQILRSTNPS